MNKGRWDNVKIEENNKKFIWDGIEVLVKLLNRNAILKNLVLTGKTVEGAVNANELEETKAKLIKFENLTQAEKIEIENRMEIWLHQRKFLRYVISIILISISLIIWRIYILFKCGKSRSESDYNS